MPRAPRKPVPDDLFAAPAGVLAGVLTVLYIAAVAVAGLAIATRDCPLAAVIAVVLIGFSILLGTYAGRHRR